MQQDFHRQKGKTRIHTDCGYAALREYPAQIEKRVFL